MHRCSKRTYRKRGAVAVIVVVVMVVLLGCAALAIDVGHLYVANEEMQDAMDASALAGAGLLADSHTSAISRAIDCAARNQVAGSPVSGDETTVVIGNWLGSTGQFFPFTGAEPIAPNAVRAVGLRSGVPLFFANALGMTNATVDRDAVASAGSGICAGLWGLEGVDGDGNLITDSYNSADGPYGPGNIFANGDICSNQDIVLEGNVEIHGDAMFGRDYDFTAYGSTYEVWGTIGPNDGNATPPPFDILEAEVTNDNLTMGTTDKGNDPFGGTQWDLVVTGNDHLNLPPGTYYVTSILVDGRASITVTGPTTLFIAGPAVFTGNGLTNVTQDPSNLTIYSTGATMNLSGTAGFYGAVIAPQTAISLVGTGEYFGTIVGRLLTIEGTADVHVDEQLLFALMGLDPLVPVLVE